MHLPPTRVGPPPFAQYETAWVESELWAANSFYKQGKLIPPRNTPQTPLFMGFSFMGSLFHWSGVVERLPRLGWPLTGVVTAGLGFGTPPDSPPVIFSLSSDAALALPGHV